MDKSPDRLIDKSQVRGWLDLRRPSLAFSSDGKTLGTARPGQVTLWDVATRRELTRHDMDASSWSFSPNLGTLAYGRNDGTIILWDMLGSFEIGSLMGHTKPVLRLAFSPDGKTLASTASESRYSVTLWELATRREKATLTGHKHKIFSVGFSPDGQALATASYDQSVRLWDVTTGRMITTLKGHLSLCIAGIFLWGTGRLQQNALGYELDEGAASLSAGRGDGGQCLPGLGAR